MFEARTYDKLMEEVLALAPPDIDTRQGSIFYDATAAVVNKIAKLYTDLDQVFRIVFITTASGEYLDLRASEYAIYRRAATPARYRFDYTGTRPPVGMRFFHNDSGFYFILRELDDNGAPILCLEAETPGIACNDIQINDIAVPVDTVVGMTSANFVGVFEYGTDIEDDESLRTRTLEYIAGPARNGNRQHYKTWCESVDGVGSARIEPLWNGENTVRAVLISPLGLPVPDSVRDAVQRYVDPADLGLTVERDGKTYVVGDGLGNGAANNQPYDDNFKELCAAMPLFYLDVVEMRAILRAQGVLMDDVCDGIELTINNNFIVLADEATVAKWEEVLEIVHESPLTLEQRKAVIMGLVCGYAHIGEPEIREVIAYYTDAAVTVAFSKGVISITIADNVFGEDNLVDTLLRRIPAHLRLKITLLINRTFRHTLPIAQAGIIGKYFLFDVESMDRVRSKKDVLMFPGGTIESDFHADPENLDGFRAEGVLPVARSTRVGAHVQFEPESLDHRSSSGDVLVARAASGEGRLYGSLPEVQKRATGPLKVNGAAFHTQSLTGASAERPRGAGGAFYQTHVTSKLIE